MQEFDALNPYFDHVAGRGAVDPDGTGHRVRPRSAIGDGAFDGLERRRNLFVRHAGLFQPIDPARHHRFDDDGVAGRDCQDWLDACVVVTPMHVFRKQLQFMRPRCLEHGKRGNERKEPSEHVRDYGRRVPPAARNYHEGVPVLLLCATLVVQPSPSNFVRLAMSGWNAARAAALKGGSPESLAPAARALAELDTLAAGSVWRLQGEYAHALIAAAMAAAQEERAEVGLHLTHARDLSKRLETSKTPATWPLPIDEAEGELWLEVDHYADAVRAYQRAVQRGGGARVVLGLARSAARLGDAKLACESYRRWLKTAQPNGEGWQEARGYVARCS